MTLGTLKFRPGVYRQGTRYEAKNRWYDSQLVRFLEGSRRPVGGWDTVAGAAGVATVVMQDTYTGTDGTAITAHQSELPTTGLYTRSQFATDDLLSNAFRAKGSGSQYYVLLGADAVNAEYAGTWVFDLQRQQVTTADTTALDFNVRASATGGGYQDGIGFRLAPVDSATLQLRAIRGSGGALVENVVIGTFAVANGGGQFRIVMVFVDAPTTTTVSYYLDSWGGGGALTLLGSRTFSANYQDSSHRRIRYDVNGNTNCDVRVGLVQGTQTVPLAGMIRALLGWKNNAGNAGQLAIGSHTKLYRFTQGVLADITPSGLTTGGADTVFAVGPYGNGYYGAFNFGEGDPAQGSEVEAAVWSLDTWGEDLLACLTSDGRLFYYDISAAPAAATVITPNGTYGGTVPTGCKALVVTPERFLFALGANGDPRAVTWASQGSVDQWEIRTETTAGNKILSGEGVLMCGLRGRNETLLFTDKDLFAAQYIGGVLVYSFKQVGSGCGIISRKAGAFVDGKGVWMGQRSFFVYDGYPRPIPSEVNDYVFKDFNRSQRHKCFAVPMTFFGEVWFFYPSAGSQEPDRCVVWNYVEDHWTPDQLSRSAGIDRGAFNYPMMAGGSTIYDHERGTTHAGAAAPYLESGPVEVGEGGQLAYIDQIIPDEATLSGQQLGSLQLMIYAAMYPTGEETAYGPYSLANPTDVRITARQLRLRFTEVVAGDWRLGNVRLNIEPAEGR